MPNLYFVQILFSVTILLLLASVIALTMRKFSASARHRIWSSTIVGLLLLPGLVVFLPQKPLATIPASEKNVAQEPGAVLPERPNAFEFPRIEESQFPETVFEKPQIDETQSYELRPVVAENTRNVESPRPQVAAREVEPLDVAKILLTAWALGTATLLLRLILSLVSVRRLMQRLTPLNDPAIERISKEIATKLKIRRSVRLFRSEVYSSVPFTTGIFAPMIVVPQEFTSWTESRQQGVLTHELGHVARTDVLWQILCKIAVALYWFHPLVWLAAWRIRVERELACDDLVLLHGGLPSDYASVLLELADTLKGRNREHVLGCTVAMARRNAVRQRIVSILNPATRRTPLGKIGSTLLFLFVVVGISVAAMLGPPEEQRLNEPGPVVPTRPYVYTLEAPDIISVEFNSEGFDAEKAKQINGRHLIGPDGYVTLGNFGRIYVDGLTVAECEDALRFHLKKPLGNNFFTVKVSVFAKNSKEYFIIFRSSSGGEQTITFPWDGEKPPTAVTAIEAINGLHPNCKRTVQLANPYTKRNIVVDYDAALKAKPGDAANPYIENGDRLVFFEKNEKTNGERSVNEPGPVGPTQSVEDHVRELDEKIRELKREKQKIADAVRPQVVSTNPPNGAKDVDPNVTELSVTFDRPMLTGGYAWYTRDGNKTFPERSKKSDAFWSEDKRTCTMRDVVLKPGKTYNIWFNTEVELNSDIPGDGFRSADDIPLKPVHYTFTTGAETKPNDSQAIRGLTPPALEQGVSVTGRVIDEDGKPVADAVVAGRTSFGNETFETKTDADGKYTFDNYPETAAAVLIVWKAGKAVDLKTFTVDPKAPPVVDFTLKTSKKPIRLKVVDKDGKPLAGFYVTITDWGQIRNPPPVLLNGTSKFPMTDENGRFAWNEAPDHEVFLDLNYRDGKKSPYMDIRGRKFMPRNEEYVLTAPPKLEISGKVVDAETDKAIPKFKRLFGWRNEGSGLTIWDGTKLGTDGTFTFSETYPRYRFYIRIEADGYEPVESRAIASDEGKINVDFSLRKMSPDKSAKLIRGTVLTPDGKPAAEATVAMTTLGQQPPFFEQGKVRGGSEPFVISCDAEGKFKFSDIDFENERNNLRSISFGRQYDYILYFLHDSGYRRVKQDEMEAFLKDGKPILLEKWGRIEGTLQIGMQPGRLQRIQTSFRFMDGNTIDNSSPWTTFTYEGIRTDNDGNFVIERVPPGLVTVSRLISLDRPGWNSSFSNNKALLTIRSGETAKVRLGGSGRPVIGKISSPDSVTEKPDWSYAAVRLYSGRAAVGLATDELVFHARLNEMVDKAPTKTLPDSLKIVGDDRQRWTNEFDRWIRETEAGKHYAAETNRRLTLEFFDRVNDAGWPVSGDGSFRLDDVKPGEYRLDVELYAPPTLERPYDQGKLLGWIGRKFTVADIPGGVSDEPLDLGTLTLAPYEKKAESNEERAVRGLRDASSPALSMTLIVLGPDGNSIPNAAVELETYPGLAQLDVLTGSFVEKKGRSHGFHADVNGRLIVKQPSEKIETMRYRIDIPGFSPAFLRWENLKDANGLPAVYTVRLDAGQSVGGILVDENDKPVAGAEIFPFISPTKRIEDLESLGGGRSCTTNAEGRWRFDSVPKNYGTLKLEIKHPEFMAFKPEVSTKDYSLQKDETPTVKLVLPRGRTTTGTILDADDKPVAGAAIQTVFLNDRRKTVSDEQGKFTLRGIPVGEMKIVVTATGKAPGFRKIDVEPDSKEILDGVDFRLDTGGTIKLHIVDREGKSCPKASVSCGEWLMEFGGFAFSIPDLAADENGNWTWNEAPNRELTLDVYKFGLRATKIKVVPRNEPYTVVMPPPFEITGSVTDAATGKPVTEYTLIPAWISPGDRISGEIVNWVRNRSQTFKGTDYCFTTTDGTTKAYRLRIEATDYLATESRNVLPDEENVRIDFVLKKADQLESTVLLPGSESIPAARASVYLLDENSQASLRNGKIELELSGTATYADDNGRFSLPPWDKPFTLWIVHPKGFARILPGEFKSKDGIRLTAWSRVEGTVLIGVKPAGGEKVELNRFGEPNEFNSFGKGKPNFQVRYDTKTDENGMFSFDFVLPGRGTAARVVESLETKATGRGGGRYAYFESFDVKPGKTAIVKIGDKGRPVTGKFVLEKGIVDWTRGILTADRPDATIAAPIQADGSFRIENAPSGKLTLKPVVPVDGKENDLLKVDVEIPAISGNISDEVFDLGTLTLEQSVRGLRSAPSPALREAKKSFTLTILDDAGKPIPGAKFMYGGEPLPKEIAQQRNRAETDKDGTFVVGLLPDAMLKMFILIVDTPGYAPYFAIWKNPETDPVPESFTVTLEKAITVGGLVTDSKGKPLAGTNLNFSLPWENRCRAPLENHTHFVEVTTDERGLWKYESIPPSLRESDVYCRLNGKGFKPIEETRRLSEFLPDAAGKFIGKFTLTPGIVVKGKITDEYKKPIEDATVVGCYAEARKDTVVKTDANGEYSFENWPEAEAAYVGVWSDGKKAALKSFSVTKETAPVVDFVMEPVGKPVKFKVVDRDGKPLKGFSICIERWGKNRLISSVLLYGKQGRPQTDENGCWTWTAAPEEEVVFDILPPEIDRFMYFRGVKVVPRDEEYLLTATPALKISGKVFDAETNKPVPVFNVYWGVRWEESESKRNEYWEVRPNVGGNGVYRLTETEPRPGYCIKIEADGYETTSSRPIKSDEETITIDMPMKKLSPDQATEISGTILTPDGQPARGAQIGMATQRGSLGIRNGYFENVREPFLTTADRNGKFKFPHVDFAAQREKNSYPKHWKVADYTLIVIHRNGVRTVSQKTMEKLIRDDKPVTLEPWSRFEGTLLHETTPVAVASIWGNAWFGGERKLEMNDDETPDYVIEPSSCFLYETTTDASGKFSFSRVPPGSAEFARSFQTKAGSILSHRVKVDVLAGKTVTVSIGGVGRPVIGKLKFDGDVDWGYGIVQCRPFVEKLVPPPTWAEYSKRSQQALVEEGDVGKRKTLLKELEEFRRSHPEIVAFEDRARLAGEAEQKSRGCSVATDGSFRLDDVFEGDWILEATLEAPKQESQSYGTGGRIGKFDRRFSVPEISGKISDEPLDLGTLTLDAVEMKKTPSN